MTTELIYPTEVGIAGVDEVGRGPLVGDVVAAAVILDPNNPIPGLADSKKLSEKRREVLAEQIREQSLCWSVQCATPTEIDQLNILHASLLAMQRAVESLSLAPHLALIDGNRAPNLSCTAQTVVKGDATYAAIAAASILAKVHRDQQMIELDHQYPEYRFAQHKGYPTKDHLRLLQELGVLPQLYRRSFSPVKRLLKESEA